MRVFTEASGSITSGYLIKAINASGHTSIGSDISEFNHGKILSDEFILMPKLSDKNLWSKTIDLLKRNEVDLVIPSLDESMLGWAEHSQKLMDEGIEVVVSPKTTIQTFQDKWLTFLFFKEHDIPTPETSLSSDFAIIKPRLGRGGSGIYRNDFAGGIDMEGMISQDEIKGEEYTVDVLFDHDGKPIYIVPRKRIDVREGKSTKGVVVQHEEIERQVIKIANSIKFIGPINFQLFETEEKKLMLIEVNPRIAGGMALGFAATENWINLIIDNILQGRPIVPKAINYGLRMVRYYDEFFV